MDMRLLSLAAPASLAVLAALVLGCAGAQRPETTTPEAQSSDPLDRFTGQQLFDLGMELAQAGDYVRAEQYFTASMARGIAEDQVMPRLVAVCLQSSRLTAALEHAEPYLARHPSDWRLRMVVATVYMGLERIDAARTELERVIADTGASETGEVPEAHYFLAVLARDDLHDAPLARLHFDRYLALAPEGSHVDEARAGSSGRPVRIEAEASAEEPQPTLPQRVDDPEASTTEEATP
jgi:hypothetical protein